jgi:hypothetical protein
MAEQREIILEQMLKVLKDIETNTCDKQFIPDTDLLEKKLDQLIDLHKKQIDLLKLLTNDRCTCKKGKKKNEKDSRKEKKEKKSKKSDKS